MLVSMRETVGNARPLVFLLLFLFAGFASLVFVVPKDLSGFVGTCFAILGVLNMTFHKTFGKQSFELVQGLPAFIANPWARLGRQGTQSLYLGIGLMLTATGCAFWAKSFWR